MGAARLQTDNLNSSPTLAWVPPSLCASGRSPSQPQTQWLDGITPEALGLLSTVHPPQETAGQPGASPESSEYGLEKSTLKEKIQLQKFYSVCLLRLVKGSDRLHDKLQPVSI